MTIFYIKMKIRAGGGALGQEGGALGQQGAPPCYSSLWETLFTKNDIFNKKGILDANYLLPARQNMNNFQHILSSYICYTSTQLIVLKTPD